MPQIIKTSRFLTVANLITISGFVLAAVAYWLLLKGQLSVAIGCFILAALTDFFDGLAARMIDKKYPGYGYSELGAKLDPLRDKFLGLIIFPIFSLLGIAWWWALIIVLLETVPIYFITKEIRKSEGKVYISKFSKILTASQFVVIGLMLLTKIAAGTLILLSFAVIRNLVYLYKLGELREWSVCLCWDIESDYEED